MLLIKDLGFSYTNKNSKQKRHFAIYKCPFCGKNFKTATGEVNRGNTQSCGCKRRCLLLTHGLSKTTLFKRWKSLKQRCYNTKSESYKNYGGRGITVCEEWKNDFVQFYNWAITHGYQDGLVIDRQDNDKGYYPENCRWVNRAVSCQNTRIIKSNNSSGLRGVTFKDNKWRARIAYNNKDYFIGKFDTPKLAAQAYNNFVIINKTAHPLNIID